MLKSFYKISIGVLIVVLLPLQSYPQTVTGSIVHDGVTRNYRLHIPPNFDQNQPTPLVFNLHGYTSNAIEQEFYSAMNLVSDTAGFLVCYPNGVGESWNVGWNFGSNEDDVGFFGALTDTLIANYNVDPGRVYSCGMSNGGFMSYRLACELNNKIAAVASVTGSMSPQYFPQCDPGRAVPAMEIHGTSDDVVWYNGTPNVSIHMDTVVLFWAENNSCNLDADTIPIPNTNQGDFSTATRIDFNDCDNDAMVSFIKIQGGGHTWPGAPISIGVTNQDINASVEIWNFFNQFSLGSPTDTEEAFSAQTVKVFPNPASHTLYLSLNFDHPYRNYEIFNSQGQSLLRGQIDQIPQSIDVSALSPGVYYLSVEGTNRKENVVFVRI